MQNFSKKLKKRIAYNVLICLRYFDSPDKGFADGTEASFPQERDQGWQNVAEVWRGNGAYRRSGGEV
jgi:hypothetical protein